MPPARHGNGDASDSGLARYTEFADEQAAEQQLLQCLNQSIENVAEVPRPIASSAENKRCSPTSLKAHSHARAPSPVFIKAKPSISTPMPANPSVSSGVASSPFIKVEFPITPASPSASRPASHTFVKTESPISTLISSASPNAPSLKPLISTQTSTSHSPSQLTPWKSDFDDAQKADQPRLPWAWSLSGTKTSTQYKPTAVGKWWYVWAQENPDKPLVASNVGRIMETELGIQLFGNARCNACQKESQECWVYSDSGRGQVTNPGSACARCRSHPKNTGCNISNRRPNKKKLTPPAPQLRTLLPKQGS